MAFKKECAILFCPHDKTAKVRIEAKDENGGFKSQWICLTHAIQELETDKKFIEEMQAAKKAGKK